MSPSVPPVTVLFVRPADAAQALTDQVVRPAAERAGAAVRTVSVGQDRAAADAVNGTDAVVLDCRHGWTPAAGQVLGAAEAQSVPLLALVVACDDDTAPPLGPTSRSLALDVDLDSASSVAASTGRLQKALDDLLPRPQVGPGPARRAPGDRPALAPDAVGEAAVFGRAEAEALLVALQIDGLTTASIADELERRGAPASWVRSRLLPRPGW